MQVQGVSACNIPPPPSLSGYPSPHPPIIMFLCSLSFPPTCLPGHAVRDGECHSGHRGDRAGVGDCDGAPQPDRGGAVHGEQPAARLEKGVCVCVCVCVCVFTRPCGGHVGDLGGSMIRSKYCCYILSFRSMNTHSYLNLRFLSHLIPVDHITHSPHSLNDALPGCGQPPDHRGDRRKARRVGTRVHVRRLHLRGGARGSDPGIDPVSHVCQCSLADIFSLLAHVAQSFPIISSSMTCLLFTSRRSHASGASLQALLPPPMRGSLAEEAQLLPSVPVRASLRHIIHHPSSP